MRTQAIARNMPPMRRRWPLLLVGFAAISSCRGGCRRGADGDRGLTVQGRLALFPASARVVAGVDVRQLRASDAASKIQELALESQADKQALAEFQRRT